MAFASQGNRDEARKWYDQAVQWVDKNSKALRMDPQHAEEIRRFRSEAEEVLKIRNK
jgi:hypothetical protein